MRQNLAKRHSRGRFYTLQRYIPTAMLSEIATEINALLTSKEAAQMIGINYVLLEKLATHGLVKRHFEDGLTTPYYDPNDVKDFIGRLRELVSQTDSDKGLINISSAARRRGVMIAPLTDMILEQRIPLYIDDPSSESFRAFRLRPESLKNIYGRPKESIVSSLSVTKILKTTRPTVYRLREAGFLKSPKIRKGCLIQRGHYICRISLEEFQASHISLNELAELSGRSSDDEFNHQLTNGAIPLPLGLRSTMIFRRSDVT